MPQNGINHPGITALAEAFKSNPLMKVINLNDNTFTDKGGIAMAEVDNSLSLKFITFSVVFCCWVFFSFVIVHFAVMCVVFIGFEDTKTSGAYQFW